MEGEAVYMRFHLQFYMNMNIFSKPLRLLWVLVCFIWCDSSFFSVLFFNCGALCT